MSVSPPLRILSASIVALLALARPGAAQETGEPNAQAGSQDAAAVAPEIRGVLRNSDLVLERLETVLALTDEQEQQQYDTLKDFVEVFLFGVDRTKPVRMDVLTGKEVTTYRLDVPVNDFRDFWKLNLEPLGIPVRKYAKPADLYRLGGKPNDAFTGYMRYAAKQRGGYATIIEDEKAIPAANGPEPTQGVEDLLSAGYDAALRLRNAPEGIDLRREYYASQRDDVLGKLKQDTDETPADFSLRKFIAGVQYDESGRIYAEAKDLVAGLTVSPDPAAAALKLRLEPLPETPLAESVALLGQQPSRFAGVPRGENAATTGRINFPLDDFRKNNLLAISERLRQDELEETAAAEDSTPEQKEAAAQFVNGFFDRIDEGLSAGVIDGFAEMTKGQDDVYTVVGGIVSPNAEKWVPLLEILPRTPRATVLKTNVGEHAGVTLHELEVSQQGHPDFHELFGGGRLLVGTGPDAVWYAAGPSADEALKQAIDQAAQPGQPEPTVVSFHGELLPWLRIVDQRLGARGHEDYRDLAIEAFRGGEGLLILEVARNDDAVDGEMSLDRGVLRFIGKALADFSAENLAE